MRKKDKSDILQEVQQHYTDWNEDNENRRTRENGWNDIIDSYNNVLPANWPYLSRVVDPRIRTTLIEKKSRLTNSKLRGRLVPREGGDVLKARINNALLDFQWDAANSGGSMNSKIGGMDMDARMFGSTFGYIGWAYEEDDGKVKKNTNELKVLDPNDCGMDPNCTHIRNARWFQMREYVTLEDLENMNSYPGEAKLPGLAELKEKVSEDTQNLRENNYSARTLQIRNLQDRMGMDGSFPVIEKVTEFRDDEWIIFAPRFNVILAQIKNPYEHRSIPIVQLRYYPLLNDPIGESEVESVLPLWRAIQATLCGYLDTMNIHMRPPLKIVDGQARMETIVWGPEANWIVNRQDSVMEYSGSGEPLRYFQATYTSLIAAFSQAMGDMSQGVSAVDPFANDKTATEVKQSTKQQNQRDENNQLYLSEMITDMMRMWQSNNQQFLLANPDAQDYVLRILGQDMFNYFKRAGLDEKEVPDESMIAISEMISLQEGNVSDEMIREMMDAASVPKYPVVENPEAKKSEQRLKPKMSISEQGDSAELYITPDDLEGMYDYIPDIKSMASGAMNEMLNAQNKALEMMVNPQIAAALQQEGVKLNVKELIQSILENSGLKDSDKYFGQIENPPSIGPNMEQPGLPGMPTPPPQGGQPMAQPPGVQNSGGVPAQLPNGMG